MSTASPRKTQSLLAPLSTSHVARRPDGGRARIGNRQWGRLYYNFMQVNCFMKTIKYDPTYKCTFLVPIFYPS